jgi:hypothetical protein
VFAIAAETGWPEERILFIPLARLAQYQHCLLRRNGVRTNWGQRFRHAGLQSKWNCYAFNGEHRLIWNKGDLPTGVWVV